MAHAYTPGLRIAERAVVRRERRLPLHGEILVGEGEAVEAGRVVARTELPGNVQTVNVAAKLSIDPARVPASLVVPPGGPVRAGEPIASGRGLLGLVRTTVPSPVDGVVESVSAVTGQVILREPPIPVEVNAYVRGRVAGILPREGVVVETLAALLQGIFGVGGEVSGALAIATGSPEDELTVERLHPGLAGRVVVGGCHVSFAALQRAREVGVAAVVVGGFDDQDLRQLLGRDLGVAITGSEELGLTLVLTEGFGRIRMSDRAWRLLAAHDGATASVSGATQIRAGVLRPEVLIPLDGGADGGAPAAEAATGLEEGSMVRAIRLPHFGRIGRVVALPAELARLDTEAWVRVLEIEFADGVRAVVPRANVERIAP